MFLTSLNINVIVNSFKNHRHISKGSVHCAMLNRSIDPSPVVAVFILLGNAFPDLNWKAATDSTSAKCYLRGPLLLELECFSISSL